VVNRTFGLFAEHFIKNVLMHKKKSSVRLARIFINISQRLEKAGASKFALWLEKRAESFDESMAINNFTKRF